MLLSLSFMLLLLLFLLIVVAYRPDNIVSMSCMGQYHSVRSHSPFHSLQFSLPSIRRRCISHYFFSFCDYNSEPCGRTSLATTTPSLSWIARCENLNYFEIELLCPNKEIKTQEIELPHSNKIFTKWKEFKSRQSKFCVFEFLRNF